MAIAVLTTCTLLDDATVEFKESGAHITLMVGSVGLDRASISLSTSEAQALLTQLSTVIARRARYAAQQTQQAAA